ncbi:MAG: MAPEG family protein [Halieaceae bacterium]
MLTPVIALISWTLIVWVWMYALRIPAMQAAAIDADDARHPGSLNSLPSTVRAVADNYNHLHEQPTVFYALAFYCQLAQTADPININLAWAYVGLRVAHSLVQNLGNKVMVRFSVFCLSSLVLVAITVRCLIAL